MLFGEYHRFLTDYGRRQVWVMRQSGMDWDVIAEKLGISADQVRAWYLRWSAPAETKFQERFGALKVEATLTAEMLDLRPAHPDPIKQSGSGPDPAKQSGAG